MIIVILRSHSYFMVKCNFRILTYNIFFTYEKFDVFGYFLLALFFAGTSKPFHITIALTTPTFEISWIILQITQIYSTLSKRLSLQFERDRSHLAKFQTHFKKNSLWNHLLNSLFSFQKRKKLFEKKLSHFTNKRMILHGSYLLGSFSNFKTGCKLSNLSLFSFCLSS